MSENFVELIAFDKHQNLQYEGKCKIKIDRLSSLLLVEPKNEDYKMISAMFKWDFYMDKNILFVFGEHESNDFCLIFRDEKTCKMVFDFICKNKDQNEIEKEILYNRLLIPICEKIAINDSSEDALELKRITIQWMDNHEGEEKEEYIKFLRDRNFYDSIFPLAPRIEDDEDEASVNSLNENSNVVDNVGDERKSRKRRHAQVHRDKHSDENTLKFTKIINTTQYTLVNIKTPSNIRRRLLIFTSSKRNRCFEYKYSIYRKLYYCNECYRKRKDISAISDIDENGDECIKLEEKRHICSPLPYDPENYDELKIITKSNFEILENCNVASGKVLIIFDPNDKKQCWEFREEKGNRKFVCRRCESSAKIWNKNTKIEYVEVMKMNHHLQCQSLPYDLKNYYEFKDFILSSDFEIQTFTKNDEERKRLIIFDKSDRNCCRIYTKNDKSFFCRECRRKGLYVSARVLKNSDGDKYALLSTQKHVCRLRPYPTTSAKKDIIVRSPNFELMENTASGKKKLFLFESNDRKLCHTFSLKSGSRNRYYCHGCHNEQVFKYKKNKKFSKKVFLIQLCKDENGENYVRYSDDIKHGCKPKKYEPEKYDKKQIQQKCVDYFFFRRKAYKNSVNVAIYDSEDKNLCFTLNYIKAEKLFRCEKCKTKKKYLFTRIEKDEKGKEYFQHDCKAHVCEPVKVSSLQGPGFITLQRNEINIESKMIKRPEIDESRIVKSANFELRPNGKGIPDTSLFIFHDEKDRSFGYSFNFSNINNNFRCTNRTCSATAKLQTNKNGEKYLIIGMSDHKCEPAKYKNYVFDEESIPSSMFTVISSNNDDTKMLIIFTTLEKNECYEFSFDEAKDFYRCRGCKRFKKKVFAKLCEDENGQEILRISKEAHICEPRKYNKEKHLQQKEVYQKESFELYPNSRGEENTKLVLFISHKKDSIYEFSKQGKDIYRCLSCKTKNHYVSVQLLENQNGEKFVECGLKRHICEPRKYDPSKYIPSDPKIISNDLFQLKDSKNGSKNSCLIIFTSNKKEFGYQYSRKNHGIYKCNACSYKNHYVTAKILEDEDDIKCVKLSEKEHVCKARRYDQKKHQFF